MTTKTNPTMSVRETADLMGLDPRTVGKAIDEGTIPAIKIGRRILVLREPLMRMLSGEAA